MSGGGTWELISIRAAHLLPRLFSSFSFRSTSAHFPILSESILTISPGSLFRFEGTSSLISIRFIFFMRVRELEAAEKKKETPYFSTSACRVRNERIWVNSEDLPNHVWKWIVPSVKEIPKQIVQSISKSLTDDSLPTNRRKDANLATKQTSLDLKKFLDQTWIRSKSRWRLRRLSNWKSWVCVDELSISYAVLDFHLSSSLAFFSIVDLSYASINDLAKEEKPRALPRLRPSLLLWKGHRLEKQGEA